MSTTGPDDPKVVFQRNVLGFQTNPTVFFVSAGSTLALVAFGVAAPELAQTVFAGSRAPSSRSSVGSTPW